MMGLEGKILTHNLPQFDSSWDYLLGHVPLLPGLMSSLGLNGPWQSTLFMASFSLIGILILTWCLIKLDATYGQLRFTSQQMHDKALKSICPFAK